MELKGTATFDQKRMLQSVSALLLILGPIILSKLYIYQQQEQKMKELNQQISWFGLAWACLVLVIMILEGQAATCPRERCCALTTCTTLYCQQQSSETWISTESYDKYQYTKLVMVNNQCKPCKYSCKRCTSESACSECYDGFYLDSNKACLACEYKCLKCQVINQLSKCSLCDEGSYLDSTSSTCKSCPVGAKSCVDPSNIVECNPGYLKSSNSLFCSPCASNCISCPTATNVCSVCTANYYASSGSCKMCLIPNCTNCLAVGSAVYCSQCSEGYYRSSSSACSACPQNCKTCTNSTICSVCKTGYYILAGGCTAVSVPISNCSVYSNVTVNGTNKCSSCASGFYLSSSSLQCIPCSITCSSCYGDHFGTCTSCISTAKLFNQMCIPLNYVDTKKMQIYYTAAANGAEFVGGLITCSSLLYSGTTLSLNLNSIGAYKLAISFRIFTDLPGQQYTLSINSSSNSSDPVSWSSSTLSSSSQAYQMCQPSTASYYSHISTATFTTVKLLNRISIASVSSSLNIHLSQLLITAYKCASLCTECSETQCFACITSNLYKQDAYCVYVCGNGYYTYQANKQCLKECPLGTYSLLTNISCMACVSPCATCLNEKYCLSCQAGYFLSPLSHTCQKQCPYRYYGSIKTQKCEQCVGRCNECITDEQCLSCQVGFLQNSTCVDTCQSGYYEDLLTLKCQKCSSACLTCSSRADYCITCPVGLYRYNSSCVMACPINFFANPNNFLCEACLYPCELCVSGPANCLSCVDGYLLNNNCLASCPAAFYEDNLGLKCLRCPEECTKCMSPVSCLECKDGYKLHSKKCIVSCPWGYYAENLMNTNVTICSKCVGLCQSCLNQTFCLSCNSNFLVTDGTGICVRPTLCLMSQYANIRTLQCEPCDPSCLLCYAQPTFCTACPPGFALYSGSCVGSCPSDYFFTYRANSSSYSQCATCQEPCLTCTDQNKCLSCVQGYKYSSNTNICSSTCSIGSYFSKLINDCVACSTDCLNCVDQNFCSVCKVNTFLYIVSGSQNKCVGRCPDGYYADTLSCMKCLYPCDLCSSSIDCLTCQAGVRYQKRCISGCPESTFMNATSNICQNCVGNCLTCRNTASLCTSCQSGYFLIQASFTCVSTCPDGAYPLAITQSCIACPDQCSKCLNNSYCTACIPGKTYLNKDTHSCLQSCAGGSYGSTKTGCCELCPSKCQTCSSNSQCLSCAATYLLTRLENATYDCVKTCPSRYYNDSNICYRCAFPCSECRSASQCLTCATGTFFHSPTSSCLLSCPLGTYYVSKPVLGCESCHSPCATCKNSTTCISCIAGYLLSEGSCVLECPSAFYADGSGICNRCYGVCKTCSSKYECLTCQTGYAYSGYCYSACPPGTYASEATKKCEPCQSPCLECTNSPAYCKKCQFNMFAYRGVCSSSCPSGTWASGEVCVPCKFPCIKCSNQFTCEQCIGGYLLYMRKSCIINQQRCPNDLYKLDSKQCVPSTWCPSTYFRDESIKTCSLTCSREKYVNPVEKSCPDSCEQGEYVAAEMTCKKWLTDPPQSLMGMRSIVFIKSSEIHIVVEFNQTFDWLENSENLYLISNQQNSRRLLSSGSNINYTLESAQQLVLEVTEMPFYAELTLPAHYIKSRQTSYNLQTPSIRVNLPAFVPYTYEQVYIGSVMKQFSEGISWFIILFSMFFLFMNRLSDVYVLWDTSQLLYLLVFLNIQYPPNLNDFLLGLSNVHFLFVPSMFSGTVGSDRLYSSPPFYAYSYDCSFLRTAGSPILLIIIVVSIFVVLKFIEIVSKNCAKVKQRLDLYPKIKSYLYKGLLRFRWHHTSDVFFLSFDIIVLFAVAEVYNISKNPNRFVSNAVSLLFLLIYIAFPCFVSYKLYKHFDNIAKGKLVANLQCFYRGIERTNKFGIFLILIRYFRKITYGVIIGVFTDQPMFALPILMFTSVLLALFMLINKPYKKRLSNIITIATQAALVVLYIIIAFIQFGATTFALSSKMVLGWVCCGLLLAVLFALIFQIFCKTMFYLESEKQDQTQIQQKDLAKFTKSLPEGLSQQYLRQKAGQFFQRIFPRLKQNFNWEDSEQTLNEYQEGDSQNSENNEEREKNWGICSENSQKNTDEFRHYGTDSQKSDQNKKNQKAPNYLIRCIKQIR